MSGETEKHAGYIRLYADAAGQSHFEEIDLELMPVNFSPVTTPVALSKFIPAQQCSFFCGPAGWIGDWHASSARNLFVVITGEWEVEASDGEIRQFGAGSVLLVEDTIGKGHRSHVCGDQDSLAILIQLE